jgi:UPF0716 protein FxsA
MPSPTRIALLLLLIALPLLEIAILIQVGQAIGFWPSVLLLLAAALVGAKIVHDQGLATARRAAEALAEGTFRSGRCSKVWRSCWQGRLILPGYVSDLAGLLLMVPPFRRFAISRCCPSATPRAGASQAPCDGRRRAPDPLVIGRVRAHEERTIDPERDRGGPRG